MAQPKDRQPTLRPPQQPAQTIVAAHHEQWSGPLPDPNSLKAYQSMVPDAPERILKVFEQDSEHVRTVQAKALDAQISKDRRGQWMAFFVIIGGMSLTGWIAYLGKDFGAILTGLATLITASMMFYRKGKQIQQNGK